MTKKERLFQMLCMTSNGGGGDKPWDEMTWDEVIAATKTDKYKEFEIGAMKELDLGTEGVVHMQIVGIDADDLADGSGYAPLTFISKELLATNHRMNPARTPSSAPYNEGTGAIGGWEKCEMRTYLKETIKPLIPQNVRNGIKEVTKYSNIYNTSGKKVWNSVTTDDVWIPSGREVNLTNANETSGPVYSSLFPDNTSRIKTKTGATSASNWWLRSAYIGNSGYFNTVHISGSSTTFSASQSYGVTLGFCL